MLAWFQKLPAALDLSVICTVLGSHSWRSDPRALPAQKRIAARLAKSFLIGTSRGEAAITVQALNGSMPVHTVGSEARLERRIWGTLSLGF